MGMPNKIKRIGEPANDKKLTHNIMPGWNWLGATVSNSISLTAAMADMNPAEGDMIKSYETMSYYTRGGWVGPMKSIMPGVGYYYHSADITAKEFVYPTKAAVIPYAAKSLAMKQQASEPKAHTVTDYPATRKYTGTMTMVAAIRNNGISVADAELQAYDEEGELRGINTTQDTDERHLVYIVLHGDDSSNLTFKIVVGEGSDTKTYNCVNTLLFEDGNSIGTPRSPYIFELSEETAIREVRGNATDANLYDVMGRRVLNTSAHGIYIRNNRKIVK